MRFCEASFKTTLIKENIFKWNKTDFILSTTSADAKLFKQLCWQNYDQFQAMYIYTRISSWVVKLFSSQEDIHNFYNH